MPGEQKLNRQSVVSHADGQVSCEMQGARVIMSVSNGEYYRLDEIGSAVWDHLQAPTPIGTLCSQLAEQYDVPVEQCEADVLNLLQTMLERQLICVR